MSFKFESSWRIHEMERRLEGIDGGLSARNEEAAQG